MSPVVLATLVWNTDNSVCLALRASDIEQERATVELGIDDFNLLLRINNEDVNASDR